MNEARGIRTNLSFGRLGFSLTVAAAIATIATSPFVRTANASSTGWTSVAPTISIHAAGAAATGHDGRIYVFGGLNPSRASRAAEAYTPGSNIWSTVAPMPTPRWSLAAAVGASGTVYALGGFGSGGVKCKNEAYNPKTKTWSTRAAMPIGGARIAAATAADGNIYVFGGYRRNFGADGHGDLNTVQIYNPTTNSWTVHHSMPADLNSSSAVLGSNGKIYLMGGTNDVDGTSGTRVWSYDPRSQVWTQVGSLSVGREAFGAVAVPGGAIYAIGGYNGAGLSFLGLKSVEAYSIDSNSWSEAPSLPAGRWELSAAVSGDTVYEIDGSPTAERKAGTRSVMSYTP